MSKIQLQTKIISSANILKVSAGTNCPQGGDSGHGGRTYFKLEDQAGTCMVVKVNGKEFDLSDSGSLEVVLSGDTECETFLDSLKFAVSTLESQLNNRKEKVVVQEIDIAD